MNITQCVDSYLLSRDVTPNYASLLRSRIRRFLAWRGGDMPIAQLESDAVNRFLAYLQSTPASRVTVDNYRRSLLCVWRAAYLERLTDEPPLRVRTIRKPRRLVHAFTQTELRRLLEVCGRLGGYFPNGVRKADFWTAMIGAAYSTGLRRGDLLRITKDQIRTDGIVTLIQSKTDYQITVRIDAESLAAIRRMPIDVPLALPWPYHINALPRQFRALVKTAGIRPGQFKWIRATSGSYAESEVPGNGPKMLGHRSAAVFHQHYEDLSITNPRPIEPPPL